LNCAGQTAVDADGNPQHPDDMRSQIILALDNLEAVLGAADMASRTSHDSGSTPQMSTKP